jgi:hypothetical protein
MHAGVVPRGSLCRRRAHCESLCGRAGLSGATFLNGNVLDQAVFFSSLGSPLSFCLSFFSLSPIDYRQDKKELKLPSLSEPFNDCQIGGRAGLAEDPKSVFCVSVSVSVCDVSLPLQQGTPSLTPTQNQRPLAGTNLKRCVVDTRPMSFCFLIAFVSLSPSISPHSLTLLTQQWLSLTRSIASTCERCTRSVPTTAVSSMSPRCG